MTSVSQNSTLYLLTMVSYWSINEAVIVLSIVQMVEY